MVHWQRAVALEPANADFNKNAGLLMHKLDLHEEAMMWLDGASTRETVPGESEIQAALEFLPFPASGQR